MTAPSLSTPWRWIKREVGETPARQVLDELASERAEVAALLRTERARGLERLEDLAGRAFARYRAITGEGERYDEQEYNDDPGAPAEVRERVIEDLATFNRLVRAYGRFA